MQKIPIITAKKDVEIKLPSVPNFFITRKNVSIPIEEFSEETLRDIGEVWIKELVNKARRRR